MGGLEKENSNSPSMELGKYTFLFENKQLAWWLEKAVQPMYPFFVLQLLPFIIHRHFTMRRYRPTLEERREVVGESIRTARHWHSVSNITQVQCFARNGYPILSFPVKE